MDIIRTTEDTERCDAKEGTHLSLAEEGFPQGFPSQEVRVLWVEGRSTIVETMTTFIYGLIDPRTNFLRYVGKANRPRVRMYHHRCADGNKNRRTDWLKCLKKAGLAPELFIIEEVPLEGWQEDEQFWISYFKGIGCPLVNGTAGGDGCRCVSEETRAKLRAIAMARPKPSLETRRKMSASHKGKPKIQPKRSRPSCLKGRKISEEHRLKIVAALNGRPVSESTREKLRLSNIGKHEAASKRCKGVPRTERDKAAIRLGQLRARLYKAQNKPTTQNHAIIT